MSHERPPGPGQPIEPVAVAHPDEHPQWSDESRHLLGHGHVGDQAHPLDPANPIGEDHDVATRAGGHLTGEPEPGRIGSDVTPAAVQERRPLVERVGMAAIALVLATLFGGVALAGFSGGEPFLGVMAAVGCLMTIWVGALTLFRG